MKLAEFKIWPTNYRFMDVRLLSQRSTGYPWTERNSAQEFSCYPGNVTFGTINDGDREGWARITVFLLPEFRLGDDAARAICLPFEVPHGEAVYVAGPFSNDEDITRQTISLPANSYALYYETGLLRPFEVLQEEYANLDPDDPDALCEPSIWCRFSFVPDRDVTAAVLRAEPGFTPPLSLQLGTDETTLPSEN